MSTRPTGAPPALPFLARPTEAIGDLDFKDCLIPSCEAVFPDLSWFLASTPAIRQERRG